MTILSREAAQATSAYEIRVGALGGPPLVRDYLAGDAGATRFYGAGHTDPDAYRRKLEEVRRRFDRSARERAARALTPTSPRAAERLAAFVERGGAVVTTGQQTGLFTGPLYTVAKALTVVRLAESLERLLEVPVLPVFWAASEDHDWAEANHAELLTPSGELRTVRLPGAGTPALPMSERVLDEGVEFTLDEAAQAVVGQPFAGDVVTLLRGAYRPGQTVSGAFNAMLAELLSPFDVLVADAADPHLKAASAAALAEALEHAGEHESLVSARSRELREAGYHAQVEVVAGATNLFRHGAGGRERVDRAAEGGVRVGSARESRPAAAVAAEIRAEPGRYSPNVLLRPIVESVVFPTLAYVAGPGEISYYAQLAVLYPEFGILPPVVYPRASLTLIDPRVAAAVEALELEAPDLARPEHELATELARRAMDPASAEALAGLRREVAAGYERLISASAARGTPLAGALGRLRNESLLRVAEAERRVVRETRRAEEETMRQLRLARAALAPGGAPQERVLNIIPFLAGAGRGLLRKIAERIEIPFDGA